METSQNQQQAVCKKEASDLIICVARSPNDQGQCVSLFLAWHQCVIDKTREEAGSRGKEFLPKSKSGKKED